MKTNDNLLARVLRNPVGAIAIFTLLVLILAAIFAPLLTQYDPTQTNIRNTLAAPGNGHLLGTDGSGRDVFTRLIYAGRFSLAGSTVALIVALVLGTTGGLMAGYFGGWLDTTFGWFVALLMALPGIIVLLAARSVVGPSLWTAMVIFGVLLTPSFYRLVYAAVRSVRNELYVDAARVSGLSDARIISRHVLTVIRAPIIVQAAVVGGVALGIQSGLEFLGLGDILIPTWGSMLNDGFSVLYRAPLLIVWPSLAIGITLMALVLLSNTIRDELERAGAPASSGTQKKDASESSREAASTLEHEASFQKGEPLLDIKNLSVGYPQSDGSMKIVVDNINLAIYPGEVHGLVGESGSGKSQTAFSVLRLLPAAGRIVSGSINFDGKDILKLSNREMQELRGKQIAYIPQEPMSNLDPSFTIGNQLVEPLQINLGLSKAEAKARALELLAKVGIPNPERTFASYPHQISGGMAQRVLIAGAISCEPDLLIADEPTTALDVTIQAEVLDVLRGLQSEMHMAILMVTHNFGVVADLCDRVSVMKTGRIVERGPYQDIYKNPKHPYTQELLGAILTDTEPRSSRATHVEGTNKKQEAAL